MSKYIFVVIAFCLILSGCGQRGNNPSLATEPNDSIPNLSVASKVGEEETLIHPINKAQAEGAVYQFANQDLQLCFLADTIVSSQQAFYYRVVECTQSAGNGIEPKADGHVYYVGLLDGEVINGEALTNGDEFAEAYILFSEAEQLAFEFYQGNQEESLFMCESVQLVDGAPRYHIRGFNNMEDNIATFGWFYVNAVSGEVEKDASFG